MSTARTTALAAVLAIAIAACGGTDGTATADLDDASVEASDEGSASPAPEPSGSSEESAAPDPSCTVAEDEAGIQVASPTDGETLDPTFRLAGCGNTFEATYIWEFTLDDGTAGGGGFGTMTCGTGCVGTFDEQVTVDATGSGVLRVFEEDAETGEPTNVVEVPITVEP